MYRNRELRDKATFNALANVRAVFQLGSHRNFANLVTLNMFCNESTWHAFGTGPQLAILLQFWDTRTTPSDIHRGKEAVFPHIPSLSVG